MIAENILYIALCLILPAGWGWLVYWLFVKSGLYRRLPGPTAPPPVPVDPAPTWDYQI